MHIWSYGIFTVSFPACSRMMISSFFSANRKKRTFIYWPRYPRQLFYPFFAPTFHQMIWNKRSWRCSLFHILFHLLYRTVHDIRHPLPSYLSCLSYAVEWNPGWQIPHFIYFSSVVCQDEKHLTLRNHINQIGTRNHAFQYDSLRFSKFVEVLQVPDRKDWGRKSRFYSPHCLGCR